MLFDNVQNVLYSFTREKTTILRIVEEIILHLRYGGRIQDAKLQVSISGQLSVRVTTLWQALVICNQILDNSQIAIVLDFGKSLPVSSPGETKNMSATEQLSENRLVTKKITNISGPETNHLFRALLIGCGRRLYILTQNVYGI